MRIMDASKVAIGHRRGSVLAAFGPLAAMLTKYIKKVILCGKNIRIKPEKKFIFVNSLWNVDSTR